MFPARNPAPGNTPRGAGLAPEHARASAAREHKAQPSPATPKAARGRASAPYPGTSRIGAPVPRRLSPPAPAGSGPTTAARNPIRAKTPPEVTSVAESASKPTQGPRPRQLAASCRIAPCGNTSKEPGRRPIAPGTRLASRKPFASTTGSRSGRSRPDKKRRTALAPERPGPRSIRAEPRL